MQGASPLVNGQLVSLPGPKGQLSDYASAVDVNWGLYPTSNETTRPSGFSDATFAYNARREVVEATGGFAGFGPRYGYTRDIGGRVTFLERRDVFSPDPLFNTSYTYTPQGYPGGFTNGEGAHSFTYDARGLVATMVAPEGTYSYEHDAAGRNRLLVFPDGHQREQAFDAQGRITSRCYRYPGQPALDRCYTSEYDATGNPVRMVDPEGEDLLTVDALDRLTSVTRRVAGQADVVETLSFNALGALGSHGGSTVSTARPRLTGGGTAPSAIPASIDGRDVSIDGLGQVVGIGSETLSWTRSGQLTGIVRAADEERYTYDAYQRRIARARGPVGGPFASVYYTYEGPNIAQEVTISPNALLRSWIYDGVDHPLRMRDARPGATTPLAYYELDLAGNVRRLRAPGGADLGGYRYAAFGKQLAADATTPAPTVDQPMRWKGRWWSEFGGAAGTYDMRARIWAPELGVFLSIDEFAYHDASSTLWGWPGQNPLRYRDPSGHFGSDESWDKTAATNSAMSQSERNGLAALGAASLAVGFVAAELGGAGLIAEAYGALNSSAFAGVAALIRAGPWGRLLAGILVPSLGNLSGGGGGSCSASTRSPLVYGPSAGGKLAETARSVGGQTLNDLEKPMEMGWEEFTKQTLNSAAASGRPVIFDLSNMKDIPGALAGTGPYANTMTAIELRYLQANWSRFADNVTFVGGAGGLPWQQ